MSETKAVVPKARSVYVAVRTKCRSAGLSMESASAVISAFHALNLYHLPGVAAAAAKEVKETKRREDSKRSPIDAAEEHKSDAKPEAKADAKEDTKADAKSAPAKAVAKVDDENPPGSLVLADKVAKQLPRDAQSVLAYDAEERDNPLPLAAIIRRVVIAACQAHPQHAATAVASAASRVDALSLDSVAVAAKDPYNMSPLIPFMRSLLNNSTWSDVTLVVDGQRIRALKAILSRSPFFSAMFERFAEGKSDTIEIKDVSGVDFESILEYIYTDAVPQSVVSPQHALRLFRLADRFHLQGLYEACAALFSETLDIDNVEECFIIALRPGHDLLKERCLEFVRENFAAVLDASNGFERTAREEPASALRELLVFKHPVRARGKWRKPAVAGRDSFSSSLCHPELALSSGGRVVTATTSGQWKSVLTPDEYYNGVHTLALRVARASHNFVVGVQQENKVPADYIGNGPFLTSISFDS